MSAVIVVFKNVFAKPKYVLMTILVSLAAAIVIIWLPNWKLILSVIASPAASLYEKLSFPLNLVGSFKTNLTIFSRVYLISVATLFGINFSLFVFYFKNRKSIKGGKCGVAAAGLGGFVSGVLGAGCGACGTFVLSSLLIVSGAGWITAILPFGGEEIKFVGILLLLFSIYFMVRRMRNFY